MSTKNLARTVIEGGRHRQNIWARRHSNAQERVSERELSVLLRDRLDPDAVVYRKRAPVYQGFDDKLRPAHRWLEAQAGRPWDKVRSELFARFDTRTTAGRHIVFDHLLRAVEHQPSHFPHRHDMLVDRHGLLRKVPFRRKKAAREQLPETRAQIDAWLAGRRVVARDDSHFWLVPTKAGYYRQDKPLALVEVERWQALPAWYRELLHEHWAQSTPLKGLS
jgi:hypothetical protein